MWPRAFRSLLFALFFSGVVTALTPQTYLTLKSQPGDYIGQGLNQTFTPADGTFSVSNTINSVSISFNTPTYSHSWYLYVASAVTEKFGRGEYDYAQRTAFRSPTHAGIDVSGDGRGCNTTAGRFLVSDFALNLDGTVARLAIDFEQHCEGFTPALYGSFRYNSTVTAIPRLAIARNFTLKGNAGTSDALISVSLSMPSTTVVQAAYATADGTALQGTDYVNTIGTVTFQPGVTAQTITVPIIGDVLARGSKTFIVKLSTPSGAPIGQAGASILIRDPNVTSTVLAMSSQPGDYVGGGRQNLITVSDAVFTASNFGNVVSFSINNVDRWWTYFAGPTSARLAVGDYQNAQRYPFQPAGVPGLSVYGGGCNTLTGNFQVLRATYNSSNVLQSFSANFEQHCEGLPPALFGWLRYHTILQQFSVTNAVIDNSNSAAVFTVTLNPPSATPVSVNFATADGTAVQGIDYVATSQTVFFSPGMTSQTISVPLLNSTVGGKTFYGQLSAPSGAAVWIQHGSARF